MKASVNTGCLEEKQRIKIFLTNLAIMVRWTAFLQDLRPSLQIGNLF